MNMSIQGMKERAMFKAAHLLLAAIVVGFCILGATAPTWAQAWQEYRPAGLGFKIDMPGVPNVSTEMDTFENKTVKAITAELDHAPVTFGVSCFEYAKGEISSQPV